MSAVRQARARRFLRRMPKLPVFLKFVSRPNQSSQVEKTATPHNSGCAVVPSKDERACSHGGSADHGIDKEYLLLVCSQIVRFRNDNDIYNHIQQQNAERNWIKQAMSETETSYIQVNASAQSNSGASDGNNGGLP